MREALTNHDSTVSLIADPGKHLGDPSRIDLVGKRSECSAGNAGEQPGPGLVRSHRVDEVGPVLAEADEERCRVESPGMVDDALFDLVEARAPRGQSERRVDLFTHVVEELGEWGEQFVGAHLVERADHHVECFVDRMQHRSQVDRAECVAHLVEHLTDRRQQHGRDVAQRPRQAGPGEHRC